VYGRGISNILLVTSLQPAPDDASLAFVADKGGTVAGGSFSRSLRTSGDIGGVGRGNTAASGWGSGSKALHLSAAVLATYDYLLYTSNLGYVTHMQPLMPVLEDLQLGGRMFPLVDIISLPAPPNPPGSVGDAFGGAGGSNSDTIGVTVSMSVFKAAQRPVLLQVRVSALFGKRDRLGGRSTVVKAMWQQVDGSR
jgi:hypothetical protein